MKPSLSLLSTIAGLALFSQNSNAFDLELLKNDKEAESHAYSPREYRRAFRNYGSSSNEYFSKMGVIFNELESKKNLCELNLYSRLSLEMPDVRSQMILFRHENRIDDLFFEIIENTSYLAENLENFQVTTPTDREIQDAEMLLKEKGIDLFDLGEIYRPIRGNSTRDPGCSISKWERISSELSRIDSSDDTLRLLNVIAFNKGLINVDEFELIEFYRLNQVESQGITLGRYLETIRETKNRYRPAKPTQADFEPNHLSSKFKTKRRGPTYRQFLYYRFSSTQIAMISNLMKKTFDRMDSSSAEVIFNHDGLAEKFEISPMGQYYLARNLLKKDLEDLNRSSLFAGNLVTHEDLVTAALETGLINGDIVDSVLKIDDLWNPEVTQWDKISKFAFRVSGTATLFLPPPYNLISSTALVFIDGIISRKHKRSRQSEALYDFF